MLPTFKEGDIWYFPAGYPHSLQGLGPDGCEFVICFDDGAASEFNTLLVTDWFAYTPPSVLAANFGVSAETFAKTPLNDRWIFQGKVPGDLAAVRKAMTGNADAQGEMRGWALYPKNLDDRLDFALGRDRQCAQDYTI